MDWFPLRADLVKERGRSFSPPPTRRGYTGFPPSPLMSVLWESGQLPIGESHSMVRVFLWLSPRGVFNSHSCPHGASSNPVTTVGVFLPGAGSRNSFYPWFFFQVRLDSLCPPVCPVLRTAVCTMPSPLLWIQEKLLVDHFVQLFTYWGAVLTSVPLTTEPRPASSLVFSCCSRKRRSHCSVPGFLLLYLALRCRVFVFTESSPRSVSSYIISWTYY